jgi:hypothetical protein
MTIANWASLIIAIIAVVTAFAGAVRWLVKHYLYELRPNGGGSLKDTVSRLERQVEEIYRILITSNINDKSN